MVLDRQKHKQIRIDGYCWGQDGRSMELRIAEVLPCASSGLGVHVFRCSELQCCQAPGLGWVACEHADLAPQTAKGPGEQMEWRKRNHPAIEGSTGSTSPGKMGKIKGTGCGLDLCSSGSARASTCHTSSNSEPMRGVSSQFCIRSKRIRSWRKVKRVSVSNVSMA